MPIRCQLLACLAAMALSGTLPAQGLVTSTDSARHALQRLAWGPVPGQVAAVAEEGVTRWIHRQLAVTGVHDPSRESAEDRLASLDTPTGELISIEQRLRQQIVARADSLRPGADAAMVRPANPLRRLLAEYAALTLQREVGSAHQLGEVLADFWFNHFNVHQNKGLDRVLLRDYVEGTIRRNALGRFETLLLATARAPAMLFYLDNAQSVAPGADPRTALAGRAPPGARRRLARMPGQRLEELRQRTPRGLNENYARELLELHTLGVEGGYTQEDIVGVARILTGWSLDRRTGRFQFNDWAHDRRAKVVLGTAFPAGGGLEEGERLLRILAAHPATRRHISAKLCARLVADRPPEECIEEAVRAWDRSDGEIRDVVRAIVTGAAFWAPEHRGTKIKSPQEFVVSAVRALGGEPGLAPTLAAQLVRLGQPLFQQSVPTGWPEAQEEWVSSAALLARMNFAMALAAGRIPGVRIDLDRIVPITNNHERLVEMIDRAVLGGAMSPQTRATILAQLADLSDPVASRTLALGLALGGPDFQRQ